MPRKVGVAPSVVLKSAFKVLDAPWIASCLLGLEKEKIFFGMLNRRAEEGAARSIRQLSIRITDACNLRCHTCGQWGDKGFLRGGDPRARKKQELPPERYRELLDDLAAHGHRPTVYLWGGEPMLYAGALEVIEHATSLRMPTAIATNGTGLRAAAGRMAAAPMFLLQVSIDGHNAEVHNAARPAAGRGDNFRDIREGLAAIKEAKARRGSSLPLVAALTTISAANMRHLVDIYEAFAGDVDIFVFYLSWWIDETRAREHDRDFARRFGFTPKLHWGWVGDWVINDTDALAEQLGEIRRRSAPFAAPAVNIIPNITDREELRRYYSDHAATFGVTRCLSIFQAVELDANGNMSPCRDYHDYVVGNVREETISSLWNSPAYRRFRASLTREGLMPACSRCCGLMGY
jgi:radical SAM protein with 4Fe4S-binding SPASM domain